MECVKQWISSVIAIIISCLCMALIFNGCSRSLKDLDLQMENIYEERKNILILYGKMFCKCQDGLANITFENEYRIANIYCFNGSNSLNTPSTSVIFDRECK